MVFIFCLSHLNILSTIAAVEKERDDFLILSTETSIIKLFSELYSADNVFQLPKTPIVFSKPYYLIKYLINIEKQKKRTLPLLLRLQPNKVIFFFICRNEFESWLIKKLSKMSSIFFTPEVIADNYKKSYRIKPWIKAIFMMIVYQIYFEPRVLFADLILNGMTKQFLKRIHAHEYPRLSNFESTQNILDSRYPNIKDLKILVLIGGERACDNSDYIRKFQVILENLADCYGADQIGIKVHPRFSMPELMIPKGCIVLPRHLPASLLLSKCLITISYASATLFESVNAGGIAISLIDVIKPISSVKAGAYKKYLSENAKGEIAYPKTIIEVQEIIAQKIDNLKNPYMI